LERDVAQGLHGVEVLGQAHRNAGGPQLLDEPGERLQQARRAARRQRGDELVHYRGDVVVAPRSLAALSMSVWYLSRTWSVSVAVSASTDWMPSSNRVLAQSRVSDTDGAFF